MEVQTRAPRRRHRRQQFLGAAHFEGRRTPDATLVCLIIIVLSHFSCLDLPFLQRDFPLLSFIPVFESRNHGVILNSTLSFYEQVANLTRSSYFHLRRLRAGFVSYGNDCERRSHTYFGRGNAVPIVI